MYVFINMPKKNEAASNKNQQIEIHMVMGPKEQTTMLIVEIIGPMGWYLCVRCDKFQPNIFKIFEDHLTGLGFSNFRGKKKEGSFNHSVNC